MRDVSRLIITPLLSVLLVSALIVPAFSEEAATPNSAPQQEETSGISHREVTPAELLAYKLMGEEMKDADIEDIVSNEGAMYAKMISIADRVIAAYPEDVTGYAMKAQSLVRQKKGEEALALADKVIALKPGAQDGNEMKIMILVTLDRPDEAISLINKVIEADPKIEDMYYAKFEILKNQKKTDEALAVADKMILSFPESTAGLSLKLSIFREQKRYPEALAIIDMLMVKEPEMASMKMAMLKEMGNSIDALAEADRTIARDTSSEGGYLAKASMLQEANRNEEALEVLNAAIANTKAESAHRQKLDLLSEMKRYEDALAEANLIISFAPDNSEGYTGKINILKEANRFEEIPAVINEIIRLSPKTTEGLFSKASTLETLGRYEEAIAAYDAYMAQPSPKQEDAVSSDLRKQMVGAGKVKCLVKLGRYADALAICDADGKKSFGIGAYRAVCLEKTGRHEEALQVVKELKSYESYQLEELDCPSLQMALAESKLAGEPKREDWQRYGGALMKMERYEDAIAAYDMALEIKPKEEKGEEIDDKHNPDAHLIGDRAEAYLKLGRFDEAVEGFRIYAKYNGECGCSKMSLAFSLKKRGAKGDDAEAAALLTEVVDKGEKDLRTAMAYALLGDRTKMLNLLGWLVKADPNDKKEIRGRVEFDQYRTDASFIALVRE